MSGFLKMEYTVGGASGFSKYEAGKKLPSCKPVANTVPFVIKVLRFNGW